MSEWPIVLTITLRALHAWLTATEQVEGAVCAPHGHGLFGAPGWAVRICPSGARGRAVLVFDVPEDRNREMDGGITKAEWAEICALVGSLFTFIETWNGIGCWTGSVAVAEEPHPTLTAALALYREGCKVCAPGRGTPFCREAGHEWKQGFALLVRPSIERATDEEGEGS